MLRKLRRMLTAPTAQSATTRFRWGALAVVVVLLAMHIVGFILITTQIAGRYQCVGANGALAGGPA